MFFDQSNQVTWHIEHKYYEELSKKSEIVRYTTYYTRNFILHRHDICKLIQVPLGVVLKNPQRIQEMIGIMRELQKYVPAVTQEHTLKVGNQEYNTKHDTLHPILFGGDQLTARNARSAQTASSSETTCLSRLEGLVPVFEDWHTRMCLLCVSIFQNAGKCY
jgi:L1 cell adhesion molecule like protein